MLEQETGCFHYPKNADGTKTGHTIAIIIRDGRIFCGEALTGGNDQFSRATGRKIALGRAEKSYQRFLIKKEKNINIVRDRTIP